MANREVHLFTLVRNETKYKVLWWEGYGVVCPSLVTTNGSYRFLVACTHDRYEIEGAEITPPDCTEWGLLDSMRTWLAATTKRDLPRLPMASWS